MFRTREEAEEALPLPRPLDPIQRFWAKVDKSGDCWLWMANRNWGGYGICKRDGRNVPAHRFAYEVEVGPVPEGLQLDHLCRNRACVNPSHLEPVTRRENILRGESLVAQYARRTHCSAGHPFLTDAVPRRDGCGRACRSCQIARRQRAAA